MERNLINKTVRDGGVGGGYFKFRGNIKMNLFDKIPFRPACL